MKNLLLFIMLSNTTIALYSMERSQSGSFEREQDFSGVAEEKNVARCIRLRVMNETPDKVVFRYQFEHEEPAAFTLVPGQCITVSSHSFLLIFYVQVYGKYRQWLTKSAMTGGFCKQQNLADDIMGVKKMLGIQNIQLAIQLGSMRLTTNEWLQKIAGALVPYSYKMEGFDPLLVNDFPEQKHDIDIFPQVCSARRLGMPIRPRYILNVPEGASEEEVRVAYRLFSKYFKTRKESKTILAFLDSALRALVEEKPKEFYELIEQRRAKWAVGEAEWESENDE